MAKDLARLRGSAPGGVVCPLCLAEYTQQNLEDHTLTEEHCVPQSVGGRITILTCKKCNNTDGSVVESHVKSFLSMLDWFEGLSEGRADLHLPEGHVGANLLWTAGTPDEPRTIKVVKKASRQAGVEELQRLISSKGKFNLTINFGVNAQKCRRGLVRAAYLCLVARDGYEYVFSGSAEGVRKLINGARETLPIGILEVAPLLVFSEHFVAIPLATVGFPQVLLVVLRLTLEKERYFGVLLPAEGTSSLEAIAGLAESLAGKLLEGAGADGKIIYRMVLGSDPLDIPSCRV